MNSVETLNCPPVGKMIDLTRTTPPLPPFAHEEGRIALTSILENSDLGQLLKTHRWGGTGRDREVAVTWLQRRLPGADPAQVLVTNGVQNALLLTLRFLFNDNAILLAEQYSYHGMRLIAETLKISVLPVRMDQDGVVPEALDAICRTRKVGALYLMPTLQNPTAITMPPTRRLEIVDVARRHDIQLIEDDVYAPLLEDGPMPLAAVAPERTWYLCGYGKTVSAGLRIGYLHAPDPRSIDLLLQRFRTMSTWFPAPLQASLADAWLTAGVVDRTLTFIRSEIAARHQLFAGLFSEHGANVATAALHTWLPLRPGHSARDFVRIARTNGVQTRESGVFAIGDEDKDDHVRICLGAPSTRAELAGGLTVLSEIYYAGH